MANTYEQPAVDVSPPTKYDSAAGKEWTGTLCLATAATALGVKVPDAWRGKFVSFQALGLDIDIGFGPAANPAIVVNQVSTVDGTTNVITFHASTGFTIAAGTCIDWRVSKDDDHAYFGFRSTGTTGFFKAFLSQNHKD